MQALVDKELSSFGGMRRGQTIAAQAGENLRWLESGGWVRIEQQFETLSAQRARQPRPEDAAEERGAAYLVSENLKGFGPKQSRNLWQWLGLTRYEIPLDSRVAGSLNNNIFPFHLSAPGLADSGYYDFVMNAVSVLCAAAEVLPCIFDAAVFASYDRDWRLEELDN